MNSELIIFILTALRDYLIGKAMDYLVSLEWDAYRVLIAIFVLFIILPWLQRFGRRLKSFWDDFADFRNQRRR